MSVFGYKKVNDDGTRNIWCPQCRHYVSTVGAMSVINTAVCVICQAANDGIELTPEQTAFLRSVRVGQHTLSLSAVTSEKMLDPMAVVAAETSIPEDAQTGRRGYFIKALMRVLYPRKESVKEKDTASKQIAKEKKRKRLFDLKLDE